MQDGVFFGIWYLSYTASLLIFGTGCVHAEYNIQCRRCPPETAYRDGYPYSHNSESGHGRQDIRKKHSCSEWKNRQDHRHQRFIYRSVAAVEHKQYSYVDVAQTFTERQTYNHGCTEGYERIWRADGGKCVVTDISADYLYISEVVKLLYYISEHKRHGECP